MWIAQTIGIEGLVGLSLAARETHTTFSLIPLRKGVSQFMVASPALTPFSFLPTISQVMSISCEVAEMISGAWGLAAGDFRAQWAFCPTLTLRGPSRRGKYPDRKRRLGSLALSVY